MFELLLGEPAFVADTEIQMLLEIFRILGSPTEKTWPGVSKLEVRKTFATSKKKEPLCFFFFFFSWGGKGRRGSSTSGDAHFLSSHRAYLLLLAQNFHVFPKWTPQDLSQLCPPGTSSSAVDLLSKLLPVSPLKRVSAREALGHSFFLE